MKLRHSGHRLLFVSFWCMRAQSSPFGRRSVPRPMPGPWTSNSWAPMGAISPLLVQGQWSFLSEGIYLSTISCVQKINTPFGLRLYGQQLECLTMIRSPCSSIHAIISENQKPKSINHVATYQCQGTFSRFPMAIVSFKEVYSCLAH